MKVSLLSADHEQELRAALPAGVRLYTGDDFNYPELIEGDGAHHSDALLGAFAAIAPAAAAALSALDEATSTAIAGRWRRRCRCRATFSRHRPTTTRPASPSWRGSMATRTASSWSAACSLLVRSLHLARVFELANEAQLLTDPDLAAHRVGLLLGDLRPGPVSDRVRRSSRLSLNQRTTASWSLPEAIKGCVDAGLGAIGIWREQLAEVGLDEACRLVAESGLRVSSLCRGGFFTTADPAEAQAARARTARPSRRLRALDAATLVLVPGGLPPGDRDLQAARDRAARGDRASWCPYAHERGRQLLASSR